MYDPHAVDHLTQRKLKGLAAPILVERVQLLLHLDEAVAQRVEEVRLEVVAVVLPYELDDDRDGMHNRRRARRTAGQRVALILAWRGGKRGEVGEDVLCERGDAVDAGKLAREAV
jgi:hypothetical protein